MSNAEPLGGTLALNPWAQKLIRGPLRWKDVMVREFPDGSTEVIAVYETYATATDEDIGEVRINGTAFALSRWKLHDGRTVTEKVQSIAAIDGWEICYLVLTDEEGNVLPESIPEVLREPTSVPAPAMAN